MSKVVRVKVVAELGNVRIPVQVDIGYGDSVIPGPDTITVPPLLDFPAATLKAYPIYTVVAEKFEAMVSLGETNTRMKDFYDLWFLIRNFDFEAAILRRAVLGTFERRKNVLLNAPITVFTPAFAKAKVSIWTSFTQRNALHSIELSSVLGEIQSFIEPILEITPRAAGPKYWKAGYGWDR